jgi:lysozyme family protein
MNFDQAFGRLIGNEGGYVNDPHDPGGETKYGISKRAYPGEDIAGMTLERAKVIYLRDFWGPAGCDTMPDLVKFQLFDVAVNTSAPGRPVTAIRMLQTAAGAHVDGVLGPETLMRAQSMDAATLLRRLHAAAIRYYTAIAPEKRDRYLAGWMNRLAANMLEP